MVAGAELVLAIVCRKCTICLRRIDFLFAVLGEEFGLIGCVFVFALFVLITLRCINWARRGLRCNSMFHAYAILGFGLWLLLQSLVNIGSNIGLLPTKGLTLPWISYGGAVCSSTSLCLGSLRLC